MEKSGIPCRRSNVAGHETSCASVSTHNRMLSVENIKKKSLRVKTQDTDRVCSKCPTVLYSANKTLFSHLPVKIKTKLHNIKPSDTKETGFVQVMFTLILE